MKTPFGTTTPVESEATNSQVLFISKLLAERDWQNGGEKYVRRAAALNIVISWAMRPMAEGTPAEISRLIGNTVGSRISTYGERVNVIMAHLASKGPGDNQPYYTPLTKAGASTLLDLLLSLPKREQAAPVQGIKNSAELTDGIYVTDDGRTIKVQEARNGSGRLYAKLMDDAGSFNYEGGLIGTLAALFQHNKAHKMTLDEAAQYGALYGRCIECGRSLTDEASIAAGIGPICAGKYS